MSPVGPVAMARVTIESSPRPVPDLAGLTDTEGRFTLSTVGPGRYLVAVHAQGFETVRIECQVAATDQDIDVWLIPER
jgi:hypothetical protein